MTESKSITDRLRQILAGKSAEEAGEPLPDAPPDNLDTHPLTPPDIAPRIAPFIDMPTLPPDEAILGTPAAPLEEVVLPATPPMPTDMTGARAYQAELQRKMTTLAEDFSLGKINRRQFEAVYTHYREQRQLIDALINSMSSDTWRKAVSEGQTGALLQRNAAQVLSYALYDNTTNLPLAMSNRFKLDAALIAPLLAAYRAAATDLGAKINSSEIEGGRWLCFVPGHYTTFVVLFSLEPAHAQLTFLEDLHHDFELANAKRLSQGKGRECAEQFMQLWVLERMI
jgi:hypothetical protein